MARAREEAGDSQLVSGRETSSRTIRVSVKTPQDYQDFLLAENSNVCHFKKQIAKRLHCDPDRLVLIFTGKILRDQDILSQRGILDGSTVHLVVRSRLKGPSCPGTLPGPTAHCAHRSEPSASESAGIPTRLGRLARNFPDLADVFCQLAPLLMMAPESLVQFLEDPLIQGLAGEKLANGSHVPEPSRPVQKRDPALKTLETFQKPVRQHELLQEEKQTLDSLKAVPGGDNAMHPICSDIQQLMFSPLALLVASKGYVSGSESYRGEANGQSNSDTTTTTTTTTFAPTKPLVQEVSTGGGAHVRDIAPNQVSSGCKIGMPDLHPGQDFPSQDSQQPIEKASQQKLSPSVLRRALHVLQRNPSLLHQLATGSPLLCHIPLLPILTNPRALQALIQIEQGLQILSKEVPGLGPFFRDPARPRVARGVPETRGRRQGHGEDHAQPTLAVLQLLHALANACSQSTQSSSPPSLFTESRYQQELEQLKALGFADHDANLQALIATDGDIHAAMERLLRVPLV
ncbi:ubiquilin-3-like [Dipodomys spectabilis]|uniref:ubiquilin-3-like n=1 Tax=Dipodomys spectabilis TaxID=105255 RepID=UPI001C53D6D6|nr:ubiquilin-3-like [Dipodomys spectabilis]